MDLSSLQVRSRRRSNSLQAANQDNHPMIQMTGVVKTFENAAGKFTALRGIDLTIQPGEFVSIVGKSGSGKSTLLNMITGIDFPTEGRVIVSGTDIYTGVTESQRSRWRGLNLGIVFQFFQLLPMLTLLENVMLPMDFADVYAFDERPSRALELLKLVGLEEFNDTLPAFVSNGQQQLAAIARALACNPPLLVADEPTGNLDHKSAMIIVDLFEQLASEGKTILMVTHDSDMSARTSRSIIISDGELIDEALAKAFPWLPDRELLTLTQSAAERSFPPGSEIVAQKKRSEFVYVVRSGEVELSRTALRRRDADHTFLGSGDHIGALEALRSEGARAAAGVTPQGPAELLAIPADKFREAVRSSSISIDVLAHLSGKDLDKKKSSKRTKSTRKGKLAD